MKIGTCMPALVGLPSLAKQKAVAATAAVIHVTHRAIHHVKNHAIPAVIPALIVPFHNGVFG